MRIVDVDPDDDRVRDVYRVMVHLRDHLSEDEFRQLFRDAYDEGPYRIAALYDDDGCRAVAGYRVFTNLATGKHLYIDDLVSLPEDRSKGHGKALNDYLVAKARTSGCTSIQLDSAVYRSDAHRFYFRERYRIHAFHFTRPLDG
jgi:ribosomal protein S18 acetylase RimI-like enzyme